MFKTIALWRHRRQAIRELSRLSDHELSDIGIARGEIETIVRQAPKAGREDIDAAAAPRRASIRLGTEVGLARA